MPLYEYECLDCGTEFEKLVMRAQETVSLKCPACESKNLEVKVSGFAPLSGSGSFCGSNCASDCGTSIASNCATSGG